jgi:hypothetical protein
MAARLSVLSTGRALLLRKYFLYFWYSFLLVAEKPPEPIVAGRTAKVCAIDNNILLD